MGLLKKSKCLKEFGIEEAATQQEARKLIKILLSKKMKIQIHQILQQNQEEQHQEKQQEAQGLLGLQAMMESQEQGREQTN